MEAWFDMAIFFIYLVIGLISSVLLTMIWATILYFGMESSFDKEGIEENVKLNNYSDVYDILFYQDDLEVFLYLLYIVNSLFWVIITPIMLISFVIIILSKIIPYYLKFRWSSISDILTKVFYKIIFFPLKFIARRKK